MSEDLGNHGGIFDGGQEMEEFNDTHIIRTSLFLALLLGFAITIARPFNASAAVFTVTNGASFYRGPGSLRAAVEQANANPGPDTIVIDPSVTTIGQQTSGGPVVADLSSIVITDSVEIIGAGSANLTFDENYAFQAGSNVNPAGQTICNASGRPVQQLSAATVLFKIQSSAPTNDALAVTFQGFTLKNAAGFLVSEGRSTARIIGVVHLNGSSSDRGDGCINRLILHRGNLEITDSLLNGYATDATSSVGTVDGSLRLVRSTLGGL